MKATLAFEARPWRTLGRCVLLVASTCVPSTVLAQAPEAPRPSVRIGASEEADAAAKSKEDQLIDQVIGPELTFKVDPGRSKVVRTKLPLRRIAVTDPSVVDVNEFSPTEFEVIGQRAGETTMTLWFEDLNGETRTLRYLIHVGSDEGAQLQAEIDFGRLQSRINELFPNSQVLLIPVADKLIVRGQARDAQEAAQIIALLSGQSGGQSSGGNAQLAVPGVLNLPGAENLRMTSVINLLHVPGEQQVLLKVRVAELTRTAGRNLGVDFEIFENNFAISNLLSGAGNISAILDGGDVNLFIEAFSSNGYGKILAEPTLVTLSGRPATFIAGGEFAVPTTVGVEGVGAVATTFRGFGTQLTFTPTVMDKDRVRLIVSPSFSTLNEAATVDGIPGLNTRAVTTTVDLREGQWLAIAGLIQDEQTGSRARVPFIGDVPLAGALFGNQSKTRNETELIVLVSPELVHPLEPEQAPTLLPGMSVTDPTDCAFYFLQQIEGHPDVHHRSTVWPQQRQAIHADWWVQKHRLDKSCAAGCAEEKFYISGPHGLSQ